MDHPEESDTVTAAVMDYEGTGRETKVYTKGNWALIMKLVDELDENKKKEKK